MRSVTYKAFIAASYLEKVTRITTALEIKAVERKTEKWEKYNAMLEAHQQQAKKMPAVARN